MSDQIVPTPGDRIAHNLGFGKYNVIEKGHWPGGAVFGYSKRDVYAKGADGRDVRSHVVLEINHDEAAVVRDIYERYANGQGYKSIAHDLNRLGVPAPRAQQGRRVGWDMGTIYTALRRELYRGEIVDGKRSKRDEDGQRIFGRAVSKRPEESWLRVPVPHLRIVPLSLSSRVDERLKQQKHGTQPTARPGVAKRYLLSGGLLRCHCGGAFGVVRVGTTAARGDGRDRPTVTNGSPSRWRRPTTSFWRSC